MPSGEEAGPETANPGAIGFDWVFVNQGGVPRLISWPRKKPITNNCKTAVLSRSLEIGCADLRIFA
jgi:hypothetical protein